MTTCSNDRDIVVYIHGWNANDESAITQANTVKKSLESPPTNYHQPIIGFSWDSNTLDSTMWWDLWPMADWWGSVNYWDLFYAWNIAKDIAEENGPKLANFILSSKSECEQAHIRLVAHSLGARVVLSALEALHSDQEFQA